MRLVTLLALLCPLAGCQWPTGEVIGDPGPILAAPAAPAIAISEIMYHPVLDDGPEGGHEFVELHNPSGEAVSLTGWKLLVGGREALVLPSDATLPAGGYLVLAQRRDRLIADRGLAAEQVLGDLQGDLDDGGDTVSLLDGRGTLVDVVRYDDRFPWPIGADGLGAGRAWFSQSEHDGQRHRGRSLERWSFERPASEVGNWSASPPGGGSPGRANSVGGEPPAVVTEIGPRGTLVPSGQAASVRLALSSAAPAGLAVEYFVDDLARPDDAEPRASVPLTAEGPRWRAALPALTGPAVVRYRIVAERDGQPVVVSPRAGDPFAYHHLFVESASPPPADAYQIFIAPARWTEMWTNLGPGPNAGCELNPNWDARVPAVVIHAGRAHDVRVRYQGSRYQRWNGFRLPPMAGGLGPSQPTDFKALSWRLSFPRYDRWVEGDDERETVTLNKQHQACPGVLNQLASRLHWAAGIRTQRFRFSRLYVNGRYYQYMMEVEDIDEDLLRKTAPAEPLGDLFKSDGAVQDNQGPWGRGNFLPLPVNPSCPTRWTPLDRYRITYERQTHEWKEGRPESHQELVAAIEGLSPLHQRATTSGDWAPVRQFLEQRFDIPQLLTQYAVRNFSGAWDDGAHNYYLYKRAGGGSQAGKYQIFPQDFDLELGGNSFPPTASIFLGEEGIGADPAGGINWLKSAVIKAFRSELKARFRELLGTVLSERNLLAELDGALAGWSTQSWNESPAIAKCDASARITAARAWLSARHAHVAQEASR